MFTITAKRLLDAIPALADLAGTKIQGNPKLAYNLGKTWKNVRAEIESINEQEIEIYKANGATDDGNGAFKLNRKEMGKDAIAAFDAQIKELHAIEIEIWGSPILLEDLEKAKVDLTAYQCDVLDWLIVDKIPEAEKAMEAAG